MMLHDKDYNLVPLADCRHLPGSWDARRPQEPVRDSPEGLRERLSNQREEAGDRF